ncbi:MAG: 4-hydroxythreonine-4-phosphate dehydrogenase PdxA [Clostridiaceae bacterium]|nr:4-hydroxythreonine-4-phosphate dehydrogenase PdxA [Clostridiaceae bacterium]
MGDPAGIGPEISVRALSHKDIYDACRPLIIGDAGVMAKAVGIIDPEIVVRPVANVGEAIFEHGFIDVLDLNNVDKSRLEYGKLSAMAGNAAFEAVKKAIELAVDREIDATVTCPINKEAINMAGHHFSGHTEIYAHLTDTRDYSMMLADGNLRVVHVSTHVALREACDAIKKERVMKVIRLAHDACRMIGIREPKVGVAGLNPHAGENGLFGREELDEIMPAIRQAAAQGIKVEGPIPPDSIFSRAIAGAFDIVVAMYHDQGHIPLKVSGFSWNKESGRWDTGNGVNITLGLPIIRTSVDHGTAFDKAGLGIASDSSLLSAIDYAIKLVRNR